MVFRHKVTALAAFVAVLAAAGCAGSSAAAPDRPSPLPTHTATPTPDPLPDQDPAIAGSWTETFTVRLDDSWGLSECLGDAPDICVLRDGEVVGNLELAEYPLDDPPLEPVQIARSRAQESLDFFAPDRADGCGEFDFVADPVETVTVGGTAGAKTGFRLVAPDGRTVERVINHYVVHDGALFVVNTDAYALAGGCLAESEVDLEFEPDVLAAFEPHIDAIVGTTPLPDASIP